ncbi:MAG TPA: hypothetical protein VIX12_05160 [Candidatus Binataceae bacterium]
MKRTGVLYTAAILLGIAIFALISWSPARAQTMGEYGGITASTANGAGAFAPPSTPDTTFSYSSASQERWKKSEFPQGDRWQQDRVSQGDRFQQNSLSTAQGNRWPASGFTDNDRFESHSEAAADRFPASKFCEKDPFKSDPSR